MEISDLDFLIGIWVATLCKNIRYQKLDDIRRILTNDDCHNGWGRVHGGSKSTLWLYGSTSQSWTDSVDVCEAEHIHSTLWLEDDYRWSDSQYLNLRLNLSFALVPSPTRALRIRREGVRSLWRFLLGGTPDRTVWLTSNMILIMHNNDMVIVHDRAELINEVVYYMSRPVVARILLHCLIPHFPKLQKGEETLMSTLSLRSNVPHLGKDHRTRNDSVESDSPYPRPFIFSIFIKISETWSCSSYQPRTQNIECRRTTFIMSEW